VLREFSDGKYACRRADICTLRASCGVVACPFWGTLSQQGAVFDCSMGKGQGDGPAIPNYMLDSNAVLRDENITWRFGKVPDYTAANENYEKGGVT